MPFAQSLFNNAFIKSLPADPVGDNFCRQVESAAYSFVPPQKTKAPTLTSGDVAVSYRPPIFAQYAGKKVGKKAPKLPA